MTTRPDLFRQLDREWDQLTATTQMRRFLADLTSQHEAWDFRTADELLAAARIDPDDDTPSVLAHLVSATIAGDDLAYRVAVQAMLPRWWTIAESLMGIPIADAIDLVVTIGTTQLRTCDPAAAATPMGWRLWCNTRRTAIRRTVRLRNDTVSVSTVPFGAHLDLGVEDNYPNLGLDGDVLAPQLHNELRDRVLSTGLVDDTAATQIAADVHSYLCTVDGWVLNPEMFREDELIRKIAAAIDTHLARQLRQRLESTGLVDEPMVDLIVDTRVRGQQLCDRAADHGVAAPTLRKRRHRAERRLRQALAA